MTADSRTLALSPQIRYRQVAEEGVIVHLERGQVLVVNGVGLAIVRLLAERPMTPEALVQAVTAEFDVEPTRAAADLEEYLEALTREAVLV